MSGRAKKKAKEAELAAMKEQATSLATEAIEVQNPPTLHSQAVHDVVAYAPRVVTSSTNTTKKDAPGDEVFRTMVVGVDGLVNNRGRGFLDLKSDAEGNDSLQGALSFLWKFSNGVDDKDWKKLGSWCSEDRYRVSTARL